MPLDLPRVLPAVVPVLVFPREPVARFRGDGVVGRVLLVSALKPKPAHTFLVVDGLFFDAGVFPFWAVDRVPSS